MISRVGKQGIGGGEGETIRMSRFQSRSAGASDQSGAYVCGAFWVTDGSTTKPSTGLLVSGATGDLGGLPQVQTGSYWRSTAAVNEERTSAIILISTVVAVVTVPILFRCRPWTCNEFT